MKLNYQEKKCLVSCFDHHRHSTHKGSSLPHIHSMNLIFWLLYCFPLCCVFWSCWEHLISTLLWVWLFILSPQKLKDNCSNLDKLCPKLKEKMRASKKGKSGFVSGKIIFQNQRSFSKIFETPTLISLLTSNYNRKIY